MRKIAHMFWTSWHKILGIVLEEGGAVVGNVANPEMLLHSMEITHEVISIGGWNSVHEPADCDGQNFDRKKERKLLSGKSKRQEASSTMVLS